LIVYDVGYSASTVRPGLKMSGGMQDGELTYSEAFPPLPGASGSNNATAAAPSSPKAFGSNQWNRMSVRSTTTTQVPSVAFFFTDCYG
jgi:hypothetical protein